ncbi:flagellar biosynthetic protein FliO [Bradymonas sediminis]|uniref:Flagellar protein n=1 Tax=Bradymonas sediminis TaxID=1548548 RepID=A0A2Z4FPK4_9DELT|nr:flagellar biosynthetic protein FliO [Bradymonas sediminis]AWV90981.1 flagellar biosynthetic protein FliO [Bradymonas sediminis]TDP75278.1 flagellar biosynthetic protein FliO [Bradymonas sediminis]
MKTTPQRKIALFLAALILLSGVLLLLFPAAPAPPAERRLEASSAPPQALEISPKTERVAEPNVGADYGMMLIKMIIAVALVCLLAYAILRWGVGRIAGGRSGGEQMRVLGRLPIAPNRTVMVVQVGPKFLVLGNTETQISLLTELSPESAEEYFPSQVSEK